MSLFTKSVLAITLSLAAFQASAHGWDHGKHHDKHRDSKKLCSTSQKVTIAAPANYHQLYSDIDQTLVTIQDVYLRTADGQVIKVPGVKREVNLQDLTGLGKGIMFSLAGIQFRDNAPTASVVEVQIPIVHESSARLVSESGECKLEVPHAINVYTAAPVTVIAGQDYLLGVTFTALDDVQIDAVTTVTQKTCCESRCNVWRKDREERSCETSTSEPSTVNKCKLANRRHLASKLLRPADEF